MFVRVGKIVMVISLVAMMGAHWAFLQTVAWTTMLASNLRATHSFSESISQTFDGEHPCPLCLAIAAGKKSEKKNDVAAQIQKMEFPPLADQFVLIAPTHFRFSPPLQISAESIPQKPSVPPPRSFFI